jgi:hypothetical protein
LYCTINLGSAIKEKSVPLKREATTNNRTMKTTGRLLRILVGQQPRQFGTQGMSIQNYLANDDLEFRTWEVPTDLPRNAKHSILWREDSFGANDLGFAPKLAPKGGKGGGVFKS